VAIAHQPATTAAPIPARPAPRPRPLEAGRVGRLAPVNPSTRTWTVAKVAGLLAVTALAIAFVTALVAGAVLFSLMNLGS
jgi:hypothetical protein